MPQARAGALWRASLPDLDLDLDAYPAAPAQYGYVELWAYPHDADDVRPLLHLFGVPALPLRLTPPPSRDRMRSQLCRSRSSRCSRSHR